MAEYSETSTIPKSHRLADLWKGDRFALRIGTDQLWLVLIISVFLFFTSLIPLIPNDFWWHLKVGEIIYSEGRIPSTNLFAWTLSTHEPFTYGAWLSGLLFYLFYRIGSLEILLFLRNLLALLLFGLLASEARRRSGSWRIAAFVVALAWLMIFNNLAVRPQIWGWLPFIAYLLILGRFVEGKIPRGWLLLLPALMVFWANAHGAFVLGIILIGAYLAGELVAALLRMPQAMSWKNIGWLGLMGLTTGLAILINPQGPHLFGYVTRLLTSTPVQGLIQEWASPTPRGLSNLAFFLSVLLLIFGLAFSVYRPRVSEILLIAGLLWMAWSGQRYIIWYALALAPMLAAILARLPFRLPRLASRKNRLNLILAAALVMPVLLVQPWFVEKFPLPENYWQVVLHNSPAGPLVSQKNPLGAADYLKANPGGKLFNEMGYGSYLIWALPAGAVFIDPRVELYPLDLWQDYMYINHGIRYNQLLEKYGADRILLDKQLQPELAAALAADPAWNKAYEDQHAQVWNRQ